MPATVDRYRRIVPAPVRRVLTGSARGAAWRLGELRLRMLAPAATPSDRTLELLRFGWGNPLYSTSTSYLRAVAVQCRSGSGAIVEAGSGLTTVLISRLAPADRPAVALEHLPEWAARVDRRISGTTCRVLTSDLRDYGDFEWYSLETPLPPEVGLVVCDGPPGSSKGGRYGALALLRDRLTPDAVLLLDDVHRDDEQAVLRRWEDDFGATTEIRGTGRDAFAVVRLAP